MCEGMRDRLIELKRNFVENFDCKDCRPGDEKCKKCITEKEVDYLLVNDVAVLPCEEVYYIEGEGTAFAEVKSVRTRDLTWLEIKNLDEFGYYKTKEEAEQKIETKKGK